MTHCALLLLLWCTVFCVPSHALNVTDLCKQHECSIGCAVPMSSPTDVSVTTQHTVLNGSFTYLSNCTFDAEAEPSAQTSGEIRLAVAIFNMTRDVCNGGWCWMRVRFDPLHPVDAFRLDGHYDFEDSNLILYPNLAFLFPAHAERVQYYIDFETCIVNPLTPHKNHCLDDDDGKKSLSAPLKRRRV